MDNPSDEDSSASQDSSFCEYVLVKEKGTPRRSSVDSAQIQQNMADVLDEVFPAGSSMTGSDSDGRITPTPDRDSRGSVDESHALQTSQLSVSSGTGGAQMPATPVGQGPRSPKADQDYTVFHGITYLGAATVNAPRSETEIKRNMAILNDHTSMAIPIIMMIPSNGDGIVRLTDPSSVTDIATYKLHRIIFCARGGVSTAERNCFAFTCSHGENSESAMFQCHVFRCDLSDAVGKIMYCFSHSFKCLSKKLSTPPMSASMYEDNLFTFEVLLDIKEDDGKGAFTPCPQDKGVFKLRRDLLKCMSLTLVQTSNRDLRIDRCFGMLVSPGRNIKNSDMHLIEMSAMGEDGLGKTYLVSGEWNPADGNFEVLNVETEKDMRVFMTVAADLVFAGIRDPVRFVVETKARIYPRNERFWYFSKKSVREKFYMHLRQAQGVSTSGEQEYEVEKLQSETQRERSKTSMTMTLNRDQRTAVESLKSPLEGSDEETDDEAPMVSGSGHVSKEITDADLLTNWAETLKKWHSNLSQRPKLVESLCRKGIPEALRGEVWQLLAGCHDSDDLLEAYRILITKESPCEEVISRDLHRTFPAHEYFQEMGGVGQDALYKLTKAYSVYDEEVGYCQGLSFLVAALLLHMPEEQAFAVLVKIMFDYQLRNFFKDGFHDLHLRFYQLERLLQLMVPDLWSHLLDMQLEAHMYASQWFLTLFTAKFPLYLVYRILDLFLCHGINTIFSVAIGLLKDSRRELLALDFEGVLKFFRVTLPKKYRAEKAAQQLLEVVKNTKISNNKLKKFEKEYLTIQAAQLHQEDPVERLERENKRLMETTMRLEQENDHLAHELVTSKVTYRYELDTAEDSVEALMKKLVMITRLKDDVDEINKRLQTENAQLKEKYRSEICHVEDENKRNQEIIVEYKQICNQLSERLEKSTAAHRDQLVAIKASVKQCEICSTAVHSVVSSEQLPAAVDDISTHSLKSKDARIRELELELARTKLALVETECKSQAVSHELTNVVTELQAVKSNWWNKSLSQIRDVVNKKGENT